MAEKKDFNRVAIQWDDKPRRVQLAIGVAEGIRQAVPLNETMTALDFGCGTGLVTFNLVDSLKHVLAVDSAEKMLEVTLEKAREQGVDQKIETQLSHDHFPDNIEQMFDVIYSSMVMHHVPDVAALVRSMIQHLAPGGYVALADLDVEEGTFHDDPTGVFHHGIDRHWLVNYLKDQGLCDVRADTVHTIVKQREGKEETFTVFLVSGRLRTS
ncbi:class I SAM-dependent methyltransferase [Desulfuromonas acetoxidans]|uniref:Methyltransferase type 12 n=1 Tax=Desulfuromonas acetoxidans (strain DSM 684 / 11070) TaxID=281689 RepID=Q1K0K5_DESA6|nr:class I SAM-dependent methyltransferase [Desulfuromonas acetoxidans]EAT15936.1 Methyltransferase type 12 [Desulfuromonas acetoxidans DSM 684]MBF0644166.1 class I SAM-dependent methyltransferase [Desulfuromonas acetoxidans]NVD24536.1 class I SAM-dependent methyltransferase [Desulfuromonas acetoxidans]NVE16514.1 class I SAM-dependent methyltransferase [Desulfuromonas acetoxidans]